MSIPVNSVADKPVIEPSPAPAVEYGLWLFILADLCIFGLYFWIFAWDKSMHPGQFSQGQASLNTLYGTINTLVLLLSSYFMASAVDDSKKVQLASFKKLIYLTILCGIIFLVIKILEYSEKFSDGFTISTSIFYRDYFIFTGFHMLHVLLGVGFLVYSLIIVRSSTELNQQSRWVEGVGIYWHMVDLLWLVLFALIYWVP